MVQTQERDWLKETVGVQECVHCGILKVGREGEMKRLGFSNLFNPNPIICLLSPSSPHLLHEGRTWTSSLPQSWRTVFCLSWFPITYSCTTFCRNICASHALKRNTVNGRVWEYLLTGVIWLQRELSHDALASRGGLIKLIFGGFTCVLPHRIRRNWLQLWHPWGREQWLVNDCIRSCIWNFWCKWRLVIIS